MSGEKCAHYDDKDGNRVEHHSNVYVKLITYKGHTFCKIGKTIQANVLERRLKTRPGAVVSVWWVIPCPTPKATKAIETGLLAMSNRVGWPVHPEEGPLYAGKGNGGGYTELFKHNVFTHPATAKSAEDLVNRVLEENTQHARGQSFFREIKGEIDAGTFAPKPGPLVDLPKALAAIRRDYFAGNQSPEENYWVADENDSDLQKAFIDVQNAAEYWRLKIVRECIAEENALAAAKEARQAAFGFSN